MLAILALLQPSLAAPAEISCSGPTPLGACVIDLRSQYRWRISYEDVPVPGNLQENDLAGNPAAPWLDFTVKFEDTDPPSDVLRKLATAYEQAGGAGRFTVIEFDGHPVLLPTHRLGASGLELYSPLLSTVVEVSASTSDGCLNAMAEALVEARGVGLMTDGFPFYQGEEKVSCDHVGTARQLLIEVGRASGRPPGWALGWGPSRHRSDGAWFLSPSFEQSQTEPGFRPSFVTPRPPAPKLPAAE
jgi:hypothetical protein